MAPLIRVIGSLNADMVSVTPRFPEAGETITATSFTTSAGGKGANQECGRILRRAIDECDQSSTEFKQGGTIESNCAKWNIDPNLYWG